MRLQRPHEYIRVDIFPVKRKWGKMVMTLILKVKKFKNKKPKKKNTNTSPKRQLLTWRLQANHRLQSTSIANSSIIHH